MDINNTCHIIKLPKVILYTIFDVDPTFNPAYSKVCKTWKSVYETLILARWRNFYENPYISDLHKFRLSSFQNYLKEKFPSLKDKIFSIMGEFFCRNIANNSKNLVQIIEDELTEQEKTLHKIIKKIAKTMITIDVKYEICNYERAYRLYKNKKQNRHTIYSHFPYCSYISISQNKNPLKSVEWFLKEKTTIFELNKKHRHHLKLDNLNIKNIPAEFFFLDGWHLLNLSRNLLSTFPKLLCTLSISHLDLSNNQIRTMPEEFLMMTKLCSLTLSRNKFSKIPNKIYQLTTLKKIDFSRNEIDEFPKTVLKMTQLKVLWLAFNKISKVHKKLNILTGLASLDLSGNAIKKFPKMICKMVNLQELFLAHNEIPYLPPEISQLTNLNKLNLSYNLIENVSEQFFCHHHLEDLNIAHNKIKELPLKAGPLSKLKKLNMSYNKINIFPTWICYLNCSEILLDTTEKIIFRRRIMRVSMLKNDEREKICKALDKFFNIRHLEKERIIESSGPFSNLYKAIISHLKTGPELEIYVKNLSTNDLNLFYEMVIRCNKRVNPHSLLNKKSLQQGMCLYNEVSQEVFDHAVKELMIEKYKTLTEEEQTNIGKHVLKLSGVNPVNPQKWIAKNIFNNITFLALALDEFFYRTSCRIL